MANTRTNDQDMVEVEYPEGGGWASAIAILPTADGYPVALIPAQHQLLVDLLNRAENLDSMDSELSQIRAALRTNGTLKLDIVNGKLEALRSLVQSDLLAQLEAINRKIVDYSTQLAAIEGKTLDYSAQLSAILARAAELKAANDDGSSTTLSRLSAIQSSFDWQVPLPLNSGAPLLNAVSSAAVSAPAPVSSQALHLAFQCFFTDADASASLSIETRRNPGSSALDNLLISQVDISAGAVEVAPSIWAGDDFISTPAYGCTEMRLHLLALSAGNLSVYGREIR